MRLKQGEFSERIVDEAVRRAGGQRITEVISPIPGGIENCDYLIGNHLLELKIIKLEPLEAQEHQKKLIRLFDEPAQEGKTAAQSSRQIHLTAEANQRYWRIVGTPVRRHLEKAASQVRSTKALLKRPDLRGAAFLINGDADSIDSNSFWNLASRHRRDFSADINAVVCFSAIPGFVQELNRPCVSFDYEHSGEKADQKFVELFKASFHSVFADKLRKKPDEIVSHAIVQPLRAPYEINTPKGKIVIH